MKPRSTFVISSQLLLAFTATLALEAANINKADNADNLNLGSSWNGGNAPTPTGTAFFDASIVSSGNRTMNLGGDVTWGTIRVDNGTGAFAINPGNQITLSGTTDASARLDSILLNAAGGPSLTIGADILINANNTYFTSSRNLIVNGGINLGTNTLKWFAAGSGSLIELNGVISGTQAGNANAFFSDQNGGTGTIRLTNANNTFTGNIELGGNGSGTRLEFTSSGALGNSSQIRFRNTGGAAGTGAILRYIGTTSSTITQQIQCDTGVGMRIESDSVGGSLTLNGTWSQSNRALYLGGTGTGNNTLAQNFTGTGSLTKYGTGTWTLTGTQGYTGATNVSSGTLLVNGTNTGTGSTTVAAGATLGGNGSLAGAVNVSTGGFIAPGTSAGLLTTGSLNLASGATMQSEIQGTIGGVIGGYDQITVNGTVTLAGLLDITMNFSPAANQLFFILLNDGEDAISGTFSGLADGAVFTQDGQEFQISYSADFTTNSFTGGNDIALMAIPEPSTALLGGLGALALLRRRRTA